MKRYLIPLLLSQIADVVTTGIALSRGGFETNPVAAWLINQGGLLALATYKLLFVGFALLVLQLALHYGGRYLTTTKIAIVSLIVLTFLAAAWNVLVIVTL